MSDSVLVLLDNALLLGPGLLIVFLGTQLLARLFVRVFERMIRRLSPASQEDLRARWLSKVSRVALLVATLLSVLFLAATVLLSWMGVDLGAAAVDWGQRSLLADPLAALSRALQVIGIVLGAVALHLVLAALVRVLLEGLQAGPLAGRPGQVALLLERVRTALRRAIGFGAALAVMRLLTAPPVVIEYLAAAAYVVVGISVARALVSAGHLAIDILFSMAASLTDSHTPLRYVARLKHLAGVSKRALEYFVYVGSATWICEQLRPDTWLAQAGRTGIRVIAIIYISRVVVEICEAVIREVLATRDPEHTEAEHQQRLTLAPVITSLLRYGVYFFSAVMALGELGLDTTPILAGAGLLGIAVGLGAQTFVGDLVSGFFILFEGVFLVGDRVQIGEVTGNVEDIGVRVTRVRDEAGVVHCIPNGEVRTVASHSRGHVNAVVDLHVPYTADLGVALAAIRSCCAQARASYPEIVDDSELIVQELREASVLLRTVTRVKPGQDDRVGELLRADLLAALLAAGVHPRAESAVRLVEPAAVGA